MYNTKSYEKSRSRLASFGNGKPFGNPERLSSNNSYPSYPEVEVPVMIKRTQGEIYKFPKYDAVPKGVYHSEIKSAKGIISKTGKPSIEICYIFKEGYTYCDMIQGYLEEDTPIKTYYIKQVYSEDTKRHRELGAAMAKALNIKNESENITLDKIIGVTELVELSYDLDSDFGQIVARKPFYEEEWIAAAATAEDEDIVEEDSDAEDASCHEEDYCAEEDFDDEDDDYLDEEDDYLDEED